MIFNKMSCLEGGGERGNDVWNPRVECHPLAAFPKKDIWSLRNLLFHLKEQSSEYCADKTAANKRKMNN